MKIFRSFCASELTAFSDFKSERFETFFRHRISTNWTAPAQSTIVHPLWCASRQLPTVQQYDDGQSSRKNERDEASEGLKVKYFQVVNGTPPQTPQLMGCCNIVARSLTTTVCVCNAVRSAWENGWFGVQFQSEKCVNHDTWKTNMDYALKNMNHICH